jgi:hypothetical protein
MASGRTLDISVPHTLGRQEARRRVGEGLAKVQDRYAGKVGNFQQAWTGDRLDFVVTALGHNIAGWLDVQDDVVRVQVVLPWLLARIAEKLRPQIEDETRRVLRLPDKTTVDRR